MHDHIQPVEEALLREQMAAHRGGDWTQWQVSPQVEMLKAQARVAGLWNLFLPDAHHRAGLTHLDFAPLSVLICQSFLSPEFFFFISPVTFLLFVFSFYFSFVLMFPWLTPLLSFFFRSSFFFS